MKSDVQEAIAELRKNFPKSAFVIKEDNEGGAIVIIEDVPFDNEKHPYEQASSWIGFRIQFQYPFSDIYPLYVRGDLRRKDGKNLGEATSQATFESRSAIQLSRRSNKRNPALDTATLKVKKVLQWLLSK